MAAKKSVDFTKVQIFRRFNYFQRVASIFYATAKSLGAREYTLTLENKYSFTFKTGKTPDQYSPVASSIEENISLMRQERVLGVVSFDGKNSRSVEILNILEAEGSNLRECSWGKPEAGNTGNFVHCKEDDPNAWELFNTVGHSHLRDSAKFIPEAYDSTFGTPKLVEADYGVGEAIGFRRPAFQIIANPFKNGTVENTYCLLGPSAKLIQLMTEPMVACYKLEWKNKTYCKDVPILFPVSKKKEIEEEVVIPRKDALPFHKIFLRTRYTAENGAEAFFDHPLSFGQIPIMMKQNQNVRYSELLNIYKLVVYLELCYDGYEQVAGNYNALGAYTIEKDCLYIPVVIGRDNVYKAAPSVHEFVEQFCNQNVLIEKVMGPLSCTENTLVLTAASSPDEELGRDKSGDPLQLKDLSGKIISAPVSSTGGAGAGARCCAFLAATRYLTELLAPFRYYKWFMIMAQSASNKWAYATYENGDRAFYWYAALYNGMFYTGKPKYNLVYDIFGERWKIVDETFTNQRASHKNFSYEEQPVLSTALDGYTGLGILAMETENNWNKNGPDHYVVCSVRNNHLYLEYDPMLDKSKGRIGDDITAWYANPPVVDGKKLVKTRFMALSAKVYNNAGLVGLAANQAKEASRLA